MTRTQFSSRDDLDMCNNGDGEISEIVGQITDVLTYEICDEDADIDFENDLFKDALYTLADAVQGIMKRKIVRFLATTTVAVVMVIFAISVGTIISPIPIGGMALNGEIATTLLVATSIIMLVMIVILTIGRISIMKKQKSRDDDDDIDA